MAEDSDLEKTEEPSPRRLEQAREKGQVPHSKELGTFMVLMTAALTLWLLGGWFMQRFAIVVHHALSPDTHMLHEPAQMLPRLAEVGMEAFLVFLPFIGLLFVAAIVPPFFLNAWVFSTQALMPDLNRLNPLTGLGRMFSWNSLMELTKAVLKAGLVGGVAVWLIWRNIEAIFSLIGQPPEIALSRGGDLIVYTFIVMVAALLIVVAADVPFQIWSHFNKLKMTKDEVKQEMKEMMGDPQLKGRIRSLQMQAARKRMMSAVPKADVIVTNPTHFAVALSYRQGMAAPRVVAKGMGDVALKIREIGAKNAVPTLEAPPLARALYRHGELDREIPSALYAAVAEVLAYIYQIANWRKKGGDYPLPPRNIPVPSELVPESA